MENRAGREHKKRSRLSCETPFRSPLQAATLLGNSKRVRQDSNKKLPLVGLVNIVTEYRLCELSRGGYPPCEMLPARLCQVCVLNGMNFIRHTTDVGITSPFQTLFTDSVPCGFVASIDDSRYTIQFLRMLWSAIRVL